LAYKNSLICIYTDGEGNIENNDGDKVVGEPQFSSGLVLAASIFNSDGHLIRKRQIGYSPMDGNHYFTRYAQRLSGRSILLPVGHIATAAFKYITEVNEWDIVNVQ
jgi:hypothetical protein